MTTTKRISLFSTARKVDSHDRIVYIDGIFDIIHQGHLDILRKAKEQGTYLIVGLYDDNYSHKIKKGNGPIFNLQERMLNILAQKYVDEVIIGVPPKMTEKMIKNF
jgi:ethanolamine-phosphate cytidylyltransferase